MRAAQFQILKRLGLSLFLMSQPLESAPQRFSTLLYPVDHKESSLQHPLLIGAANIEMDFQKQDLELVIWRTRKAFALEVNINVKGVNQSVLPTDADGKLLSKVTSLGAIPWIKVYMPGRAPQTLDVTCVAKTHLCQGVWKNFPYDPEFEGNLKIEANIRGLEGKVWSPSMTRFLPNLGSGKDIGLRSATLNPPYSLPSSMSQSAARVEITRLYDLLSFPNEFSKLRLLSVHSWSFKNDSQIRRSGYFRILRKTLFHLDKGQALVDLLNLNTLQTFEVLEDQSFWAQGTHILGLASKKLGDKSETHFRVLEFEQ